MRKKVIFRAYVATDGQLRYSTKPLYRVDEDRFASLWRRLTFDNYRFEPLPLVLNSIGDPLELVTFVEEEIEHE